MDFEQWRRRPLTTYLVQNIIPQQFGHHQLPGANQLVDKLVQQFKDVRCEIGSPENVGIQNDLRTTTKDELLEWNTYVKSLTTRTNNENDSLAAFCFWSFTWQQKTVYRWINFSIRSNGDMNVRNVVINASPYAANVKCKTIWWAFTFE